MVSYPSVQMTPPEKEGSGNREGKRGALSVVHGGSDEGQGQPKNDGSGAPISPNGGLPSSNALKPNSNLHMGFCLPAETRDPGEVRTTTVTDTAPSAPADPATDAASPALTGGMAVTSSTALSSAADPPPRRHMPGRIVPNPTATVPADGNRRGSGRVRIVTGRSHTTAVLRRKLARRSFRVGYAVATATAVVVVVVLRIGGAESPAHPAHPRFASVSSPPILPSQTAHQARRPRERPGRRRAVLDETPVRHASRHEPSHVAVAAAASSSSNATQSPSAASTPAPTSATVPTPQPTPPSSGTNSTSGTASSGSNSVQAQSSNANRPAFGANGTLGPGTSPNS